MADADDMDLMRRYAEDSSEAAFGELVRRHINFVYSVALRHVGGAEDAQDVTQAVFIILARKISGLRQRANLTGWLYEATRFTARQLLRTQARRRAREQEAYMESIVPPPDTDTIWKQLAPILEDAMSRLSEKDRSLLALRFFENKSMAETASVLGLNEWAVCKRAERAVEKLRVFFHKRGIAIPASVLTSAISANSVHAAPVGLAGLISATAFAKGAVAAASTLTLTKGASKLMFWSKTKIAISTGLALILIAGVTTLSVAKIRRLETRPMPAPGKTVASRALEISTQFIEVPDSLLDGQNLDWQPGDSGASTAVISTLRQTNLVRAIRRDRNAMVVGLSAIAFDPTPGKTSRGGVTTEMGNKSTTKQKIGTHLGVTATVAPDSQSVDLKLDAGLRQPVGGTAGIRTNEISAATTLSLNPGQSLVMRAPLHDGIMVGDSMDASAAPRSLVVFVTPKIQNVTIRYQPILRVRPGAN